MGQSIKSAQFLIDSRMADAARGDIAACFDLGIVYSTGTEVEIDMIEAHKWFNLAAIRGNAEAALYRQELALEMTKAAIAEAQRAAREWLRTH